MRNRPVLRSLVPWTLAAATLPIPAGAAAPPTSGDPSMLAQPSAQTTAATPQDLMATFARLVGEGAIDRLVDLYEPEAVFVPAPGVVHTGLEEIRQALSRMLALSPQLETRIEEVHQADDTALVIVEWTLRGTSPDGTPVTQGGRSADVLRRQADGSWRVLIDHP